jgi:hypothetical protein
VKTEDPKRQEPGKSTKDDRHPLGPLMKDGVTRFKPWSDRLMAGLVDNLNRKGAAEQAAEAAARDKARDH